MSDLLYVAMSGAEQTLAAQNVYANNLANINTPGFRGDFVRFHTEAASGDGFETRAYVVLDDAEERANGETLRKLGTIFLRGDTIILISPA